jgi:hypothetical protein
MLRPRVVIHPQMPQPYAIGRIAIQVRIVATCNLQRISAIFCAKGAKLSDFPPDRGLFDANPHQLFPDFSTKQIVSGLCGVAFPRISVTHK